MGYSWIWWLTWFAIILGIILLIIGIVGYFNFRNKSQPIPSWTWGLIIAGIILIVIGVILFFVYYFDWFGVSDVVAAPVVATAGAVNVVTQPAAAVVAGPPLPAHNVTVFSVPQGGTY